MLSFAVIKYYELMKLDGRKAIFHLIGSNPLSRDARTEAQGGNLEARSKAEAMEEC